MPIKFKNVTMNCLSFFKFWGDKKKSPTKENNQKYEYSLNPDKTKRNADSVIFPELLYKEIEQMNFKNLSDEQYDTIVHLTTGDREKLKVKKIYHGGCLGCIVQSIDGRICEGCSYHFYGDDYSNVGKFWAIRSRNFFRSVDSDEYRLLKKISNTIEFKRINPEMWI